MNLQSVQQMDVASPLYACRASDSEQYVSSQLSLTHKSAHAFPF